MIYKYLPYFIFKPLFGDRKRWGLKIIQEDEDYQKSLKNMQKFYNDTQKGGIGKTVNNFGFKIMKHIDLSDKTILEVGPGSIEHLNHNHTKPKKYILCDIRDSFLDMSEERLKYYNIDNIEKIKVDSLKIPLDDSNVDIIITFHQLEHIYELDAYLKELKKILKPNGILIGAVPTEGGIAWGFGRFLTSRRYVKKNMDFDYDKIIWMFPTNYFIIIKVHM